MFAPDLAFAPELPEQIGQRLGDLRRRSEPERRVGPALGKLWRLVGHRGHREVRVAETVQRRADREVEAGAPGRKNEIDLVLIGEALDRLDGFLRTAAVVVFDHFDRQLLVAELDAAGGIHILHPQLVIRQRGDAGAAGIGPRFGNGIADPDLLLRLGRGCQGSQHCRNQASDAQQRSTVRRKHVDPPSCFTQAIVRKRYEWSFLLA